MNLAVKWSAIATTAVAALYLVMPQEKLDQAHESWLRLTHDSGQACLDYERQQLKDPDSARLLSAFSKDGTTTIKYKAKNSYGAYGTSDVQCAMSGYEVEAHLTDMMRETQRSYAKIKEMERRNDCLKKQVDLQWSGVSSGEAARKVRESAGCEDFH